MLAKRGRRRGGLYEKGERGMKTHDYVHRYRGYWDYVGMRPAGRRDCFGGICPRCVDA